MTSRFAGRPMIMLTLAILAIAATPRPAPGGPGEAGSGRRPAVVLRDDTDYVVLVWYRGDDALGTFQYQTYDVRKGDYTPAVDDWIVMMRTKYPHYVVRALPVNLALERGDTEKLRVGSVIQRELLLAAARSGVVLGAPMRIGPGPNASPRPSSQPSVWNQAPGAGGASNLNLPGNQFPFPTPYTRPRP